MKIDFSRRLSKGYSLMASFPAAIYRLGRKRLGLLCPRALYYVVPGKGWVTDWVGYYITRNIATQFGWRACVTSTPHLLVDHIVHYGEMGAFLSRVGSRCNRQNTVVATIFHGARSSRFPVLAESVDRFVDNLHLLARVVTACRIMQERLIAWGASPEKVVRVPLGVDLSLFTPVSDRRKREVRRRMGVPDGAVCIGSFQKDGVGWGEGLVPKLIKGPDIFIQVVERLKAQYNLFVLLTGPARGYVKQGLKAAGIPYKHRMPSDFRDIVDFYRCLDLYLVTSREEGGPKAVLESLATGVPLVSTRVGLAPDVIQHGHNGLLADQEDIDALAEHVAELVESADLRRQLIAQGLRDIAPYDWSHIAAQYYHQIYLPLLGDT
jgi:glycosyltransferase involved in cell wall biosynthesis